MSVDEYKFWRRETNKFAGRVGRFLKKKKKIACWWIVSNSFSSYEGSRIKAHIIYTWAIRG